MGGDVSLEKFWEEMFPEITFWERIFAAMYVLSGDVLLMVVFGRNVYMERMFWKGLFAAMYVLGGDVS